MNAYLRDFLSTANERFSADASNMSMSEWITSNTTLRKRPFSFKGFEFQKQIIDDMHPSLCCIKVSQIGLSESQFRKYFAFLRRNTGTTGIYTMPTEIMRDRISQTRVKPMIDADKVFNPIGVDKPVRQKGLYQIDQSFGYFTGSSEGDATSISADLLMHDEIDLTDQTMVSLFQSRLQGSRFKITQSFSTPTYHGYGIDLQYQNSDQHEYLYRCPHCRHHQIPTFTPMFVHMPGLTSDVEDLTKLSAEQIHAIDHENAHWCCERCRKPLDLHDPTLREWVAKHPGRAMRGYRVRPTTVATITLPYVLRQLLNYSQKDNIKGFCNTVIGEAYEDGNARLSEAEIRALMDSPGRPEISPLTPCFIGIDMGLVCNLILATSNTTVLFEQVPEAQIVERVSQLLKQFNIVKGCIDRFPYTPTSEQIRDISGGKIMPVGYATTPSAPSIKEVFDINEQPSHWNAARTKAIDAVVGAIRRKKFRIGGYGNLAGVIVNHLRDMVRVEAPDQPAIWNKVSGEDHIFHAFVYLELSKYAYSNAFGDGDRELRTHCFVEGVGGSSSGGLNPHDLNKITGSVDAIG